MIVPKASFYYVIFITKRSWNPILNLTKDEVREVNSSMNDAMGYDLKGFQITVKDFHINEASSSFSLNFGFTRLIAFLMVWDPVSAVVSVLLSAIDLVASKLVLEIELVVLEAVSPSDINLGRKVLRKKAGVEVFYHSYRYSFNLRFPTSLSLGESLHSPIL